MQGRLVGDGIAAGQGIIEIDGGSGIALGGLATGPGVVVVSTAGVLVAAHGSGVVTVATADAIEVTRALNNLHHMNGEDGSTKSSGRNGKHANKKAKNSAKEKYEEARAEYEALKSKPNKTREDNQKLLKAKKQMEHWKKKGDWGGENHSMKNKK